jgi:hypothetical protein
LRLVLARRRRGDQGGVNDGAPGELQALSQQQLADLGEQRCTEVVLLQKMAKLQQRGPLRHALADQVDAAEIAERSHSRGVPRRPRRPS